MADRIQRKWIGTRVGFVSVGVLCYFGTIAALASFPDLSQPETWSAFEWFLGVLFGAIVGDTARPSGVKTAAFGVTASNGGAASAG